MKEKDENDVLANVSDFQQTFGTKAGRRVLGYLMQSAGFLNTSFVAGDPYTSAYNEGQRALVLAIVNKLRIDIKELEKALVDETEGEGYVSFR